MDFFCYVQWIAHQQWRDIKAHAEQSGVALMGDIPFGISYYSADVFSRPNEFMLDWFGGAPPEPLFKDDAFTQKWGQNWGIPLYRWGAMRANNFNGGANGCALPDGSFIFPDRSRPGILSRLCLSLAAARGTANSCRSSSIRCSNEPAAAHHSSFRVTTTRLKTAKRTSAKAKNTCASSWKKPAPRALVGEDLGVVPDYVRPNLQSLGIAGFKIPQWEIRDGMVIPGEIYERLSVATYATHDHEPIRALWDEHSASRLRDRTTSASYTREDRAFRRTEFQIDRLDSRKGFYPSIMDALFRCNSSDRGRHDH